MIQYNNIKPLISPTIDVTFGKLLAVQSVTSAHQETAGPKILLLNKKWEKHYN